MIRYLQGITLLVATNTLLASIMDTPREYYHHRSFSWLIECLIIVSFITFFVRRVPWSHRVSPVIFGMASGAILAMVIDNSLHGGVEDYWTVGSVVTCLPDFVYVFAGFYTWVLIARYLIGKFYAQKLKEA